MSTLAPHAPLHRTHAIHHDAQSAALALALDEQRDLEHAQTVAKRRGALHALGRFLLAALFLTSAGAKLLDFNATQRAMDAFGLAGSAGLLFIAITAELVGGTMLAVGWHVRRAALGLVTYLVLASIFFHHDLSVDLNRAFALTNVAIAGGLLLLVAHGAGAFSLSAWLTARRQE